MATGAQPFVGVVWRLFRLDGSNSQAKKVVSVKALIGDPKDGSLHSASKRATSSLTCLGQSEGQAKVQVEFTTNEISEIVKRLNRVH
uniref:COMM domain-containing protein n=1 Tax=Ascaris lumbricoides TaxID=6252 RepID=A0A0M3IJT4_ASCLU